MQPLAYRIRPNSFNEIVGQDHLVGPNGVIALMMKKNQLFSLILYGGPGTGKTTIASIIAKEYGLSTFEFNASIDNKSKLKDIIDNTNYYDTTLVVIDEIHRMKKDTQDFLLPYIENGKLTIIGLTTENPYISINTAVRSRCHIYKLNSISPNDVMTLLKNTIAQEKELFKTIITDDILDYIVSSSGCEIRTALNMLEALSLIEGEITMEKAQSLIGIKSIKLDSKGDNYYDILSAFQKSIRGSDVDASLHYLARLILLEDIDIICRRLTVIAYEDIGLANPQVGPRVIAACQAAKNLGFPEARIPLACITIDLALSPKSNTSESSINSAIDDLLNLSSYEIPKHILNREIKGNSSLYKYPHDYPDDFVEQQYLPTSIINKSYYIGKSTGKYERALNERNEYLKKFLKKS